MCLSITYLVFTFVCLFISLYVPAFSGYLHIYLPTYPSSLSYIQLYVFIYICLFLCVSRHLSLSLAIRHFVLVWSSNLLLAFTSIVILFLSRLTVDSSILPLSYQ
jgi:hypothetical protein